MTLRRTFILLTMLTALACTASVRAQGPDVHNIQFDTLRTGMVEPTRIAVEDMKYVGASYIVPSDSGTMRSVAEVIRGDLDFYADFELVRLDSFFLRTYEIKELDNAGWLRLGAEYLVRLEAEFPQGKFRIRWHLFDTNRNQEIAKGTLEDVPTNWRIMAHEVSNQIVRTLTGEKGIFHTKIAYIRRIGKAKELFMADYDGANEQQLTRTGTTNISPTFAPNKDDIYFTSFKDGYPHLWKIDLVTRGLTRVAAYNGIVAAPAISPDGNKIACVLSKDGNSEIYVLDTQGKVIKRLTNNRAIDTSPTWSPDGRMIAFVSDRTGSPQVYIMDGDGFNVHRLTYDGDWNDSPIWSDRGDRITFVSRTPAGRFDLASIDTSGGDYRILTNAGSNENPHFSPDGKHLIFASNRLGSTDIYTATIVGKKQRRLTKTGDCSNPTWGPMQ